MLLSWSTKKPTLSENILPSNPAPPTQDHPKGSRPVTASRVLRPTFPGSSDKKTRPVTAHVSGRNWRTQSSPALSNLPPLDQIHTGRDTNLESVLLCTAAICEDILAKISPSDLSIELASAVCDWADGEMDVVDLPGLNPTMVNVLRPSSRESVLRILTLAKVSSAVISSLTERVQEAENEALIRSQETSMILNDLQISRKRFEDEISELEKSLQHLRKSTHESELSSASLKLQLDCWRETFHQKSPKEIGGERLRSEEDKDGDGELARVAKELESAHQSNARWMQESEMQRVEVQTLHDTLAVALQSNRLLQEQVAALSAKDNSQSASRPLKDLPSQDSQSPQPPQEISKQKEAPET